MNTYFTLIVSAIFMVLSVSLLSGCGTNEHVQMSQEIESSNDWQDDSNNGWDVSQDGSVILEEWGIDPESSEITGTWYRKHGEAWSIRVLVKNGDDYTLYSKNIDDESMMNTGGLEAAKKQGNKFEIAGGTATIDSNGDLKVSFGGNSIQTFSQSVKAATERSANTSF